MTWTFPAVNGFVSVKVAVQCYGERAGHGRVSTIRSGSVEVGSIESAQTSQVLALTIVGLGHIPSALPAAHLEMTHPICRPVGDIVTRVDVVKEDAAAGGIAALVDDHAGENDSRGGAGWRKVSWTTPVSPT